MMKAHLLHFILIAPFHFHSNAILEERKPRLREMNKLDQDDTALRGEAGSEDPTSLFHVSPLPHPILESTRV